MSKSIQHIKMKIANYGLSLLAAGVTLVFVACNDKEDKHSDHNSKITEAKKDSSMQHDAMEGMQMNDDSSKRMNNMSSDTANHSSHNTMDGMSMNDKNSIADTAVNEIYWNTMPANQIVISTQKAVEPVDSNMNYTFKGNGYISFDFRRSRKVPVRIGGRIERLYVKYNYQYIRKGEKILELYSPEINTYIEEFLFLTRQPSDSALLNKARQKLLLLGLSAAQINQIQNSSQAPLTISVYSPFEGYVLFNPSAMVSMGTTGNTSAGMGGMNSGVSTSPSVSPTVLPDNSIREGMYVAKDQTLFWVNDFKEVWGIAAFTKENEKYLRKGLPVTVISELIPEKTFQTSVQFMEQIYQSGQKFSQARVYLPNTSGILKQNSLITISSSIPVSSLMVPASSVYYLGKIAIVWVRTGVTKEGSNVFQSRVVRIGHRDGKMVQILEGLNADELIAKDAGYMADSETIIKY
ncbi:MAG TPA: efflux RND transporter periplasmic adaptor subunit [Chitinophagaceae bacterium]|nr:efflux RND transporter periplasmic adaptor subunit [Chitinophagaceae bacterium]